MIINKHSLEGTKGETVCYSLPNFRFDHSDNKLKWDAFRFYTPLGHIADNEGARLFNVMGAEVPVHRDRGIDKHIFVRITRGRGIEVFEVPGGVEKKIFAAGLEGDVVVTVFIPADPNREITVDYKEVLDDITAHNRPDP